MYTEQSIQRVREADIVTLIESYCSDLKRKGASYFCKSPFKDEKSASFNANPIKNNWVCYSTSQSGDGIKFVMLVDKCDFLEAVKKIASICKIYLDEEKVPEDVMRLRDHKKTLVSLANRVGHTYVKNYNALDKEHWAKKHVSKLGYTPDTLINFQIGYAKLDNQITKACIEHAKLSEAKEIAITNTNNNQTTDFFKNRIIFPIEDINGNVIAYGGRRQNGKEFEKYPKYLNSKESLIYTKTNVLYGFNHAKQSIGKSGFAILTEGYTDVITMHNKGCSETVATCGTALGNIQIKQLKRFCEHVILFRDGDAAGVKASLRDLDMLLPHNIKVSIVPLPEKEDPDSWARGQIDMRKVILENMQDAVLWKSNLLVKGIKRSNYELDIANIEKKYTKIIEDFGSEIIRDTKKLKGVDLIEARDANSELQAKIKEAKKEKTIAINNVALIDPNKKAAAIDDIIKTLMCIKGEIKRNEYIKIIAKIFSVPPPVIKNQIAEIQKQANDKLAVKASQTVTNDMGLPKGANQEQFLKDRFCIVGNQYHFQNSSGFFPGTQFAIQALFHIKGKKENKRLCELTNTNNQKQLVDLESDSFVSFGDFKKQLVRLGYYIFLSGSNTTHFDLLSQKILKEFTTALELQTMGWNTKGFFAFANGVYWNDKFQLVNKYGIMHLEGVDTDEADEYNEKVEYYYSPAYSVMHKKNQDGDDPYENDRKFIYKQSPITLLQWQEAMLKVFPDKGSIGILFNFATLFRDLFLKNYDFFPLLGGFGEKDSGKSGFGKVLQNFFFYGLEPLELNQATLVGFNRRLSRTTNTNVFLDEYHDRLDERIFQAMKGAWNGLGREKGMATNDKRTIYDKVNSAIYYAGQYLPTRDDNSLATRTICLQFPSKNYTPEEKDAYNQLMAWTAQGLSSLVVEVLKSRTYFESNLPRINKEVTRELKDALTDVDYQERIFGNYSVLLITYKLLEGKLTFPFTYESIFEQCIDGIIENSENIQDSNGLTEFWNVIEWLHEHKYITEGQQFKIDKPLKVQYQGAKKQTLIHENTGQNEILFLRLNTVHQDYVKEVTKRDGMQSIGETTLRNYFKSRGYYIGPIKSKRFEDKASSCYAFDYTKMKRGNILNIDTLQKVESTKKPVTSNENQPDKLAF